MNRTNAFGFSSYHDGDGDADAVVAVHDDDDDDEEVQKQGLVVGVDDGDDDGGDLAWKSCLPYSLIHWLWKLQKFFVLAVRAQVKNCQLSPEGDRVYKCSGFDSNIHQTFFYHTFL